jgi:hypothetical protein
MNVRMTPDEWAAVKKKADESGVVMSDFVRASVLARVGVASAKENKKDYRKKNKKEYREVAEQIARVGNNINQLARWANTYKSAAEGARMIVLFSAALAELKRITAMVMGE